VANLTLTIDEALLQQARLRAVRENTSVNAVVREFLARYAQDTSTADALGELLELSELTRAGKVGTRRRWTREDIYSQRLDSSG